MRQQYPTTYLIASDSIDILLEDLLNHKLAHKHIQGRYEHLDGQQVYEDGFAVVTDNESLIKSLAFKHAQESVLKLDQDRNASLLFTDGKVKNIGTFKAVTVEYALKQKAYTKDITTGIYYTCEQN